MQTIYLSDDDTIDIIADKIKNSRDKEINLVVISKTIPVLSVINLKMLRKIAENLNKIISISTADEAVKILAKNAGVKLEETMKSEGGKINLSRNNFNRNARLVDSIGWNKKNIASSARYQLSKDDFDAHAAEKEERQIKEEEAAEEEAIKFQVPKTSRNIFIGFSLMAAIAALAAGYIYLPTAKITITPKANPVNANFEFIIDKNAKSLDIGAKKIPATVLVADIEKDRQFTATGKKQITSNAKGTVAVYNEWSSYPQQLVANTRLAADDGKIYKKTKSIVVPGFIRDENGSDVPGKIEAPIIASEPGSEYNIDSSSFTIPGFKGTAKYAKIYAKSSTAITGGAKGYTTVPSDEDFKNAKEYLEKEAKKDITSQLNDKKPSDLTMIDRAISVKSGDLISTVDIDQPAEKFKASLKITAVAFLFNPNDAKAIANSILKEINEEKKNFALIESGLDYGDVLFMGTDTIKISAQAHANVYNLVNENDLRTKIAGKNKQELEKYIKEKYPDISAVNVALWPFWVSKISTIENNISISLDIPKEE